MSTADPIPVLLGIDVEPDDHVFPPGEPSLWRGFELLHVKLKTLRTQLEDLTGEPVAFGWALRMDPQVVLGYGSGTYVVDRYAAQFEELVAAGDELGIHPHAWRWIRSEDRWISEHSDQSWLDECLDVSVDSYRAAFGRPPPHHRFGGGHMSTATMNRVGHHGIPLDLTLEPGGWEHGDRPLHGGWLIGGTGDFRAVPRSPYRPDPHDFRVPAAAEGSTGPTAIPLTSGGFQHKRHLAQVLRDRGRHPVATTRRTVLSRVRAAPDSSYELLAMWKDWRRPSAFWDSAFTAAEQVTPRYMSFAIRSSSGLNGPEAQRFDEIIQALLRDRRTRDLRFITPARALATLTPAPAT